MKINDLRKKGIGVGLLAGGLLALLLGSGVIAKAQESRDEVKPQQEEQKKDEAKPQKEAPRDVKPQREEAPAKMQEGKPEKNETRDRAQETHNGHEAHPAAQRGQKIPDEKFRASFGRQHTFHVQKTVIVEGQPRFQYGGYWFALAQPWPEGWAYTDDCYLDYIDGEYVLIDLLHPGMQLAIIVVG